MTIEDTICFIQNFWKLCVCHTQVSQSRIWQPSDTEPLTLAYIASRLALARELADHRRKVLRPTWILSIRKKLYWTKPFELNNNACLLNDKALTPVYLDNNNCAPSFLRSLCEIGDDFLDQGIFLAPSENTEVQNNHQRIHTMSEK